MSPATIRLFWDSVSQVNSHALHESDDSELILLLMEEVRQRSHLDPHQQNDLNHYITNRLPLIREIATCG
ncbi:MAG: hypothetical protein HC919_04775 [Oscillatoriales cyanobacterium SM2_2_1]|nr:hypothetical protein [Oscillatoriales cyanobacterium SM2_2_1]